jgi:hypothetical protein
MKKITPQTEQKLMRVLEKVAEYTADGDHPNAAIIKAGANVLRPGEVELVVHAYNVGKTNCQRESEGSILEKTAAFALADADTISAELFPANVKTAAQREISTVVSSDYSQSARATARQIKAAQAPVLEWPAAPVMQKQAREKLDTKAHARQTGDLQRAVRDYEVKRAAHRESVQDLAQAVDEFGNYFRSAGAPSQLSVKAAATVLHGPAVVQSVFDSMYASQPGLATIASATRPLTKIAASSPAIHLLGRVLECAMTCREKAAAANAAAPAAIEKRAAMYPAKTAAVPWGNSILDTVIEKKVVEKQAAFLPSFQDMGKKVHGGMQNLRDFGDQRTDPETSVNKALYELTDPDHEEQLRQLQARTSFQELMARDPVLQGHDPRRVADSYGQITQTAPNLASQPLALQALMRKQLEQGHMDTFDVNDMIGLNNNLQDRFSGMNDVTRNANMQQATH